MIDHQSTPGSWAKALQAPCSSRTVSEFRAAEHPTGLRDVDPVMAKLRARASELGLPA